MPKDSENKENKNIISFTTFNLHNLNEPGLPMYKDKDGLSNKEFEKKVEWSAEMLKRARADVFGFQELWHNEALRKVLAKAGMTEDYLPIYPENHAGQEITCAAAVKKGMLVNKPEWITNFPEAFHLQSKGEDKQTAEMIVELKKFSRPVLKFKVKPKSGKEEICVFVCHFKSKGPTSVTNDGWYRKNHDQYKPHVGAIGAALSTIRRTAEALALRIILTEQSKNKNIPIVVLGDLNDGQDSNTLDILTQQPQYLTTLVFKGSDTSLYSAQALQQLRSLRDVYYTYIHNGVHGSLDHILVSEELYDNSQDRLWKFDRLDIFNDHLDKQNQNVNDMPNDHGIVRAQFSYHPAKQEC